MATQICSSENAERIQPCQTLNPEESTNATALRRDAPQGSDPHRVLALGKFYGQAERPISTGKLHALLRFHLPPIKVVVFDWPSYPPEGGLGDLISRRASRLDAFSDYLFRTSLPSYATGVTARSQEVRPSRSSRTRDSPSQVSCARTR